MKGSKSSSGSLSTIPGTIEETVTIESMKVPPA
jgi:hypothetical protein